MNKTMSRNKKRTDSVNARSLEAAKSAVRIQRTLRDDEAFYFYEDVGKPTGEAAKSLSDFLDKIKYASSGSLMFHHLRGDFKNWIEVALGDAKLAGKLGKITSSNGDDVRVKICKAIENRLKKLTEPTASILVEENLAVLEASS